MSSDTAKGAQGEASSAKGPAPQPSLITPVDDGSNPVYAVELPIFEGPLDLLLHLVRRHELDILDIPIAFVTEKYLEYLEVMRALDIEIAGDYLVMAATLAYLKSRELVPQQDAEEEESDGDDDDGEDPREALIRRLIEYERFRAAGRELNEMPVAGRDVFTRGGSIDLPPLDPGMAPVTLFRLAEAYARVLQRAKISKSHEVVIERVTVRQRMEQLSLLLEERGDVEFDSLFLEREWSSVLELRQMLVVTLMSVLELVKLGIIGVQQPTDTATIRLLRRASYAAAMQALTGYDEDASFGVGVAPTPGAPTPAGAAPTAGVAPQHPPAAAASGSPVARGGDAGDSARASAALGEGDGDGLDNAGSAVVDREASRGAAGGAERTVADGDAAVSVEESEALADPYEDGVEDEPVWGAFAADDAAKGHGLPGGEALADPEEDDVEDGSDWSAFATIDAAEVDVPPEREVPATRTGPEDGASGGADGSSFAADDSAEGGASPQRDALAGSSASAGSGVHEDAAGWGAAARVSELATLTEPEHEVSGGADRSVFAEATGDGGVEPKRPLDDDADAVGGGAKADSVAQRPADVDAAGGPPEVLAEGRGDPREVGWIPAATDEDEQASAEERPPEDAPGEHQPAANEAVRAARVDSEAPMADDHTRDGPSTVDGGEDPRESDE